MSAADPRATALFLREFFDELTRFGVRNVVVCPGSRSTPLAMTAYELSRRHPDRMRVFVDVDERGAGFFALGMAKASGHPAAVICTSGTAVGNFYPAVLEAESSRVPLLVLTGDRPPRLQDLGAPQTCDQLKAFGDHARVFRQMQLPSADPEDLRFARQAAREACIAAGCEDVRIAGACCGGPVHLNFPFEEPLKPDFSAWDTTQNVSRETFCARFEPVSALSDDDRARMRYVFAHGTVAVLAGEGTCATESEAVEVLQWAEAFGLPLLADPLSGLRSFDHPAVIDNYDSVAEKITPNIIIRFGRYPVSKKATQWAQTAASHVVVDPFATRDFNAVTDSFVRMKPIEFVRSLLQDVEENNVTPGQVLFLQQWQDANDKARDKILHVESPENAGAGDMFEGSYVRRIVELAPEGSCLFAANSMSIRSLDTFYVKTNKRLTVLCNRGLNGIDGTISTAIGAARSFDQVTLLTGDLTMLHDLNALALQRELLARFGDTAPSVVIVLLNNNGGAIFDMLPQKSDEDYFNRLFLTPQDVDFCAAAAAFSVPYRRARTVEEFDQAYRERLGMPGISLIEVPVPLEGLKERYARYW